jgi:hypothetical protein
MFSHNAVESELDHYRGSLQATCSYSAGGHLLQCALTLQNTSEHSPLSVASLSIGSRKRKSSLIASTSTLRPALACTVKHVLHNTVELVSTTDEWGLHHVPIDLCSWCSRKCATSHRQACPTISNLSPIRSSYSPLSQQSYCGKRSWKTMQFWQHCDLIQQFWQHCDSIQTAVELN